ncbi:MAG TPA: hypothetical protein VGP89_12230 [Candidatus Angelobacter sp.]|jgi:sterol desaturase/sphingolipid hydroxylase (fatty acid hydroxylase superfamily)|nr:hypothetical protein [Candidatus Angelobacter sp.]
MIFLKSIAAGLTAVLATAVVIAVVAIVALLLLTARNEANDTVIGWDPVEFGRAPLAWIIFLFTFAAGFYWQYRRLAAH